MLKSLQDLCNQLNDIHLEVDSLLISSEELMSKLQNAKTITEIMCIHEQFNKLVLFLNDHNYVYKLELINWKLKFSAARNTIEFLDYAEVLADHQEIVTTLFDPLGNKLKKLDDIISFIKIDLQKTIDHCSADAMVRLTPSPDFLAETESPSTMSTVTSSSKLSNALSSVMYRDVERPKPKKRIVHIPLKN